jgi:hypothetical protein
MTELLNRQARLVLLDAEVNRRTQLGWKAISRDTFYVRMATSKPNVGLHAVLSVLTCGAWLIPFIAIMWFALQSVETTYVDPYGEVKTVKGTYRQAI